MKSSFLSSFRLCLILTSMAVLPACKHTKSPESLSAKNSQDLLSAEEGAWQLVEDDGPMNPVQRNLAARREVNPDEISKKNRHTQNVADSHAKDDSHFRVLKLERQMPGEVKTGLYGNSYVPPKNSGVPVASTQAVKAMPTSYEAPSVVDFRTGQHPGKERIVLDVTKKTKFDVRLTDNNTTLVIELPDASWGLEGVHSFGGAGLLKSYTADAQGKTGVVLKIALSKPVRIVSKMALPGNDTNKNNRIVLDISGA